MLDTILDIIPDTLLDTLRLLPFLFLTYLLIEWIEHKAGSRTMKWIRRSGKWGPVLGGALGLAPQCGFSASIAGLYSGGIITKGTLLAVFLSTSDEMLPILLSEQAELSLILKILAVKLAVAILAGTVVDLVLASRHRENHIHIHEICSEEHCHCEKGIFRSALHHTLQISLFILLVSFALNAAVAFIGQQQLASFILNRPILGECLAGIIGLIPNCAASVVITQLYLQGGMSAGAMLSGLLVGSGLGILVLFRTNQSRKDSLLLLGLLYGIGVTAGILVGLLPLF